MKLAVLFLCGILLFLWSTEAKTVTGTIEKSGVQWAYLAKFVFRQTNDGANTSVYLSGHDFNGSTVGLDQKFLLYHDVSDLHGFQGVYQSHRSCLFKESKNKREQRIADLPKFNLSGHMVQAGVLEPLVDPLWMPKQSIPRWWYIAISHCNPVNLHYYKLVGNYMASACKLDDQEKIGDPVRDVFDSTKCEEKCNEKNKCHTFTFNTVNHTCILYKQSLFEKDVFDLTEGKKNPQDFIEDEIGSSCYTWDRGASNSYFGEKNIFYGVHAEYAITFKNGNDKFRGHFSDDETGIFEFCIVMFVILFILSAMYGWSFYYISKVDSGNMSRSILLVSGIAVLVHFLANILALAHYDAYSNDGIGLPSLFTFVLYLEQVPEIMFITLCLLLARGTFISNAEFQSKRSLVEIIFVYSALVVAMLSMAQMETNDLQDAYYLETPYGVVLLVCRFLILVIFCSEISGTYGREVSSVKKRFYRWFAAFGFLFFCTLPVAYLIASTVYDYHRKKTDYITQQALDAIGYILFWAIFGTGKGGYVKTEADAGAAGHKAISTRDDDDTADDETRI